MESKQEFLDKIKGFNDSYDMDLISRAYDVAEKQHEGQLRKSGEPYIIHPVATAEILAEDQNGTETHVAPDIPPVPDLLVIIPQAHPAETMIKDPAGPEF